MKHCNSLRLAAVDAKGQVQVEAQQIKISIEYIAVPPNNNMELTGRMRHVPCKRKSKGHAAFVLQLMYGR